jgi:hypothetical protein
VADESRSKICPPDRSRSITSACSSASYRGVQSDHAARNSLLKMYAGVARPRSSTTYCILPVALADYNCIYTCYSTVCKDSDWTSNGE